MDHRVEPPSWLPQGAAREAAEPEADDSSAVEDAQPAEDSSAAPAEGAPEEFSNGNGHDSSYTYARDDSYHYGDDSSLGEGTSYRSPFSPNASASTSYASEEPAQAENGLPASDPADYGGSPEAGPSGHDLPASGLGDRAMPDTGFPAAAAHFQTGAADDTDTAVAPYPVPAPAYTDPAPSPSDPAPTPHPATEPLAPRGTAAAEPGSAYSSPATESRNRRAAFGPATATVGGISAAFRAGKQRGSAKLSRGGRPPKRRPGTSQARRANLVIARVEPWSVMKFSFLISLVLWIVMFVAVALLYYALSSLGVFAALQRTLASVTSSQTTSGVDLTKWTSATRVLGYTMLLGAVDVVLITAISTVGAVIYNLVTHLGGGIEVTLKETE